MWHDELRSSFYKALDPPEDLTEKAKVQGQHEEVAYTKFDHWCRNSAGALEKAIQEEKDIAVLTYCAHTLRVTES
eukprot:5355781-Amphidinium_carterae.2